MAQGGAGANWADPVYDTSGNMTQGPKPGAETTRQHLKYDAWNRLVVVSADDGNGGVGSTVATYAYDGLGRRVRKVVAGSPDVTYDYYFNESWQIVEARKNASLHPQEQYVYDARYIDAPVIRWYDGNTDGTAENGLYYLHDANFNVTGLMNAGYPGDAPHLI